MKTMKKTLLWSVGITAVLFAFVPRTRTENGQIVSEI